MSNQYFPADSNNNQGQLEHLRHRRMVEPLISLYQDGEASEAEGRIVQQYLATCPECRVIYASYQQVVSGLRSYLDNLPEPRFRPEAYPFLPTQNQTARPGPINSTPTRQKPSQISQNNQPRPERRRLHGLQPLFSLAGVMAALLLIVVVGLFYLASSRPPEPTSGMQPVQVGALSQTAALSTESATSTTTTQPTNDPNTPETSPNPRPTLATTISATQPNVPPQVTYRTITPAVSNPGPPTVTALPTQRTSRPSVAPVNTTAPVPTNAPVAATNPPVASAVPAATTANSVAASTAASQTAIPETTVVPTTAISTATPEAAPTTVAPPVVTTEPITTAPATTVAAPTPSPEPSTPAQAILTPPPPNKTTNAPVGSNAPGWITYVDRSDTQIHLVHSDGSDDQLIGDPQVFKEVAWEQLVWSNDGRWIAVVGIAANRWERGIYLIDLQNSHKIEFLAEGFAPVWSPDNRYLTYLASPLSLKGNAKQGRPALFDLKKRSSLVISTQGETFAPQWFDDSARILIGQDRLYDIAGGQTQAFKLAFTNECVGDSLSPSGNKLAVLEQGASGKFETVIYDLSKGRLDPKAPLLRVAAPVQGAIGQVCGSQRLRWTPDSKFVYYYTSNNPSYSTCLVQASNGTARCLSNVYDPSFTSDGSSLVDYSPSSGVGGLVYSMLTAQGGRPPNPRLIAETRIPPVWQPK